MKPSRDISLPPKVVLIERRRRRLSILRIVLYIVCALVFVFGLSYISKLQALAITQITSSGNVVIPASHIEESVNTELSGVYLHLFSKRNSFLYPKAKIEARLRADFPRIATLSVTKKNIHTLLITITEQSSHYLWCGETYSSKGDPAKDSSCYFLNTEGKVFAVAPYFSGNVYFKFFGSLDEGTNATILNATFLPEDRFQKVLAFLESLKKTSLVPFAFEVVSPTEFDILLSTDSTNIPRIRLSATSDLEKTASDLGNVLATEALANDLKTKPSQLLYIDLRFPNKAYYKFSE